MFAPKLVAQAYTSLVNTITWCARRCTRALTITNIPDSEGGIEFMDSAALRARREAQEADLWARRDLRKVQRRKILNAKAMEAELVARQIRGGLILVGLQDGD